jgi:hypothetical protein
MPTFSRASRRPLCERAAQAPLRYLQKPEAKRGQLRCSYLPVDFPRKIAVAETKSSCFFWQGVTIWHYIDIGLVTCDMTLTTANFLTMSYNGSPGLARDKVYHIPFSIRGDPSILQLSAKSVGPSMFASSRQRGWIDTGAKAETYGSQSHDCFTLLWHPSVFLKSTVLDSHGFKVCRWTPRLLPSALWLPKSWFGAPTPKLKLERRVWTIPTRLS